MLGVSRRLVFPQENADEGRCREFCAQPVWEEGAMGADLTWSPH